MVKILNILWCDENIKYIYIYIKIDNVIIVIFKNKFEKYIKCGSITTTYAIEDL